MTRRSIAQAARDGAARLGGIANNPALESRLLLAQTLGVSRNDLIRDPDRTIETANFDALLSRRAAREPLALILGHREFWSMEFKVSSATLIPRADSETLVEAALAAFAKGAPPHKILDLGTGTGCLLLALLKEFPCAFGIGLDFRPDAAILAQANASQLGLADQAAFVVGDWTNPIAGRFDLIISNPPYIRRDEIATLMPEVGCYEPRQALDGGSDGYDAYRVIVPGIPRYLKSGGAAILEVGLGQASYVAELGRMAGLQSSVRSDLAGVARAVVLMFPDCQKNCLAGS